MLILFVFLQTVHKPKQSNPSISSKNILKLEIICKFYFAFFVLQVPFECENRYRVELTEEQNNKLRLFLRHVESFDLICLLTEYLVCGDVNSLPINSEDLE